MRKFSIIFSLFALPFFLLALETDPAQKNDKPEGEIAERERAPGDVAQEYNLYDRQQNQRDQYQRREQQSQQQQYYYQQSGNNYNDAQYRRTRRASQFQYFNPRDE